MMMAWTILSLALTSEAPRPGLHPARPCVVASAGPAARPDLPRASRSLSASRKTWHRACPGSSAWGVFEEFDTEEVDESWMGHLDAVATVPSSWLGTGWTRRRPGLLEVEDVGMAAPSRFPLRC